MFAPTVAICPNVPPDPVFRSMRVSVSLPFGSCQARLIWVVEAAVADRPVGASGEATVPVPVTALVVPPAPLKVTLLEKVPAELRSEEHTSELQSLRHLVCRLLLEKKKICQRVSLDSHLTI